MDKQINNKNYYNDVINNPVSLIHRYLICPLAFKIAIFLYKINIKANYVTTFRIILNIIALFFFYKGNFYLVILGLLFFQLHEFLDTVDGIMARLNNSSTRLGFFLEKSCDYLFSSIPSFFGISIMMYLTKFYQNYVFINIYIFITSGIYITKMLKRDFEYKLKLNLIKNKILNIVIKEIYIWQNQILILAVLFTLIVNKTFSFYICISLFIFLLILNNISWIYTCFNFWNIKK